MVSGMTAISFLMMVRSFRNRVTVEAKMPLPVEDCSCSDDSFTHTGWKLRMYHILKLNKIKSFLSQTKFCYIIWKHIPWRFLWDRSGISTFHTPSLQLVLEKPAFSWVIALFASLLRGELCRTFFSADASNLRLDGALQLCQVLQITLQISTSLQPPVIVWCSIGTSGIIGTFWFESCNGTTTTVTTEPLHQHFKQVPGGARSSRWRRLRQHVVPVRWSEPSYVQADPHMAVGALATASSTGGRVIHGPSLSRLDNARLLHMGVLEVKGLTWWSAEPDRAEARHQEGGQRHQQRKVPQSSPPSKEASRAMSLKKRRAFRARAVAAEQWKHRTSPKNPKNALWDDITKLKTFDFIQP